MAALTESEPLEPVPLRMDSRGAIRVGETRVTLEMVILSFINGLTPEEIVAEFSSLELGNVYSVLGYYLHHKDDVHEYLRGRQEYSDAVWDKIEAHQSQNGLRDHLLARLKNSE